MKETMEMRKNIESGIVINISNPKRGSLFKGFEAILHRIIAIDRSG